MILMAFMLLVIVFLVFFVYFSGLNPHEVVIFLPQDYQLTAQVPLVIISCILIGLVIGYLAHLYGAASYLVKGWRHKRSTKRDMEVGALVREGRGYLCSGDYKKSRRLLQKALTMDGSRTEVLLTLAELALAEGNPGEAVNQMQRARKLAPQDLAVLFCLANSCLAAGQQAEAIGTFALILEIDDDSLQAMAALRDIYLTQYRWRDALELQKRVVKITSRERQPGEKALLYGLRFEVAVQAGEGGMEDHALAELESLVKEAPEFLPARVTLGDLLLAMGRSEQAAGIWQEGYRNSGRSVFLSRLEDLAMAEEDPTSLLTFYRKTVDERPDDLTLRLFYGKFCLRLEMIEDALDQFSEVEKTGADFPWLHLLQAETHVRRQRHTDAVGEYRRALGGSGRFRWGYVCQECGEAAGDWRGRCERCGTWGTLQLTGYQLIKSAPALDLRAIHHGERQE
jgi:tetratricopeptide (TPR) repeat protein